MARRTLTLDYIERVPDTVRPSGRDYVDRSRARSGIGELLWEEVYLIEREAGLRPAQKTCVEMWLMGSNQTEIAAILRVNRSTVCRHLKEGLLLFQRVSYRGLLTDMIERFGVKAVREHLADTCD